MDKEIRLAALKRQNHHKTSSINTPEGFDSDQLLAWYNKQAILQPDFAGVIGMYDEPQFGLRYRQEAEWSHFRRIVPLNKNMRVLELGCGAGRWALRIAPFVSKVVGVDFSKEMIKLAREHQHNLSLHNVEFYVSVIQDVLWKADFDVVYLSGVTQHLNESQLHQTLSHIRVMLAPRGILIDRTSVSLTIREISDYDGGYHGIYRTVQELISSFGEFGFNLTFRAPSYKRMHLPSCFLTNTWLRRGMSVAFQLLPKTSFLFVSGITWLMEKVKPAVLVMSRSHEFFVFREGKSL